MGNRRGLLARLAAVALVIGLLAAWTIAALADTGVSVSPPGTGCTVYAEVSWNTSNKPPVHSEGDVQCGTPEPDPTSLLRDIG
ncbi:MAG: hypothetical protein M3271_09535 [Actinomycetota bacterium]|nr:hypothetical protein [Actinomycetota bacterium]